MRCRPLSSAGHRGRAWPLRTWPARLATFGLPQDTFDRFVPGVEAVTPEGTSAAARQHIRPDEAVVVVVGDSGGWRETLSDFGRPVEECEVEF